MYARRWTAVCAEVQRYNYNSAESARWQSAIIRGGEKNSDVFFLSSNVWQFVTVIRSDKLTIRRGKEIFHSFTEIRIFSMTVSVQ